MPDSNRSDTDQLPHKHERNRQERLEAITRWVEYIETNPPEVWGPQQNQLVNTQLESAQETGLSVDHTRRIQAFARHGADGSDADRTGTDS